MAIILFTKLVFLLALGIELILDWNPRVNLLDILAGIINLLALTLETQPFSITIVNCGQSSSFIIECLFSISSIYFTDISVILYINFIYNPIYYD